MSRWWALGIFALIAVGCGGGGGDLVSQTQEPGDGQTASLMACADLWAPGQDTRTVIDNSGCRGEDGRVVFAPVFTYDCPDGRLLVWNDEGWGYDPGTWQAHERADGQLVPPQADLDACG
jgi:hypothetical protein